MSQENKVPTQIQLDCYIDQAKVLRTKAIAALAKRLFRLPVKMFDHVFTVSGKKNPERASTAKTA